LLHKLRQFLLVNHDNEEYQMTFIAVMAVIIAVVSILRGQKLFSLINSVICNF